MPHYNASRRSLLTGAFTALSVLCLVSLPLRTLHAQSIEGQVVDSARNAPLAGAKVLLIDSAGVVRFTARADSSGHFLLRYRPGRYRFEARKPGYRPVSGRLFTFGDSARPMMMVLPPMDKSK